MSAATRLFYKAASTCRLPEAGRSWSREAVIFSFHNVVGPGSSPVGDRSLHLERDAFTEVVEWMARAFVVVPLAELLARAEAGGKLKRLAAITFDDAYQGVFTHAIPELERVNLPATVFVVSTWGESPAFSWWDLLAEQGRLTGPTRELCLEAYRGDRTWILDALAAGGGSRLPGDHLPAPWSVIQRSRGELIGIGSHTRTHRNLAVLPLPELQRELRLSREEIGARLGDLPDLISYP